MISAPQWDGQLLSSGNIQPADFTQPHTILTPCQPERFYTSHSDAILEILHTSGKKKIVVFALKFKCDDVFKLSIQPDLIKSNFRCLTVWGVATSFWFFVHWCVSPRGATRPSLCQTRWSRKLRVTWQHISSALFLPLPAPAAAAGADWIVRKRESESP